MSQRKVVAEYFLSFNWPCCRSCDGFRCDSPELHDAARRQVTLVIIGDGGGRAHLEIEGEDAEEFREVLGL